MSIRQKYLIILLCVGFSIILGAQEIQHEAIAVNIEVPVRVFKGQTFIDNLTIDDFEIYENGILQTIEAVYLIRNTEIERSEFERTKEEMKEFTPNSSRTFVLMFEIIEYLPQIGDVLDFFFKDVIRTGDSLIVASPTKTYNLNSRALERVSKEEIAKQLIGKLREDANLGSSEYRSLVAHFRDIDEFYYGQQEKLQMQLDTCRKIKQLTFFDKNRATDFSNFLKAREGQKQVFFFFQKRTIPIPESVSPINQLEFAELINDISFDAEELKYAFSDSSISCHFIYITKTIADGSRGSGKEIEEMESGMQTYRGFSAMAEVTGGLMESSANVSASFQKAVHYSENYYLLYYSPKNYKADGKFKTITVKVKGGNYRITYRAGYIAD
jgi:hypothetical protein